MATGRLTKRSVDALQPQAADVFLWDDEVRGFGLRVTPRGARSYVFQYRLGGREAPKRRITIGRHGSPWTPANAREEAERLARLVSQGTDPVAARRESRREAVELEFSSYAERFIRIYLAVEWGRGWKDAAALIRREAVPAFKGLSLRQITRSHMTGFLDGLADRRAVRRNAFALVRLLMRWAVARGDLELSPLSGMIAPPAPKTRDRVLSDDELSIVWEAAGTLGYPWGPFYRLLILLGQRREEVAGLSWPELDGQRDWILPGDRTKNGQTHFVPLSNPSLAEIHTIAVMTIGHSVASEQEDSRWPHEGLLFSTTGTTPVSGFGKAKARLDAAASKIASKRAVESGDSTVIKPWRVHDLRRTLATGLQRLGVRFEVTEAVLNHVSGAKGGVAGVYQRHDWKEEKRAALEAWGRYVTSIGHPERPANVVLITSANR